MAKTIQPISSWQNGEEKQATVFVLVSTFDDLSSNCTFQYQLNESLSNPNLYYYNTLVSGSLIMSGQDYLDWDAAIDANEWAYTWAATQLKLVIIPDQVVA